MVCPACSWANRSGQTYTFDKIDPQRGQTYTFDKMAGLTEAKDNKTHATHGGVRPTHSTHGGVTDPQRGQTYTFDKMAELTEAKDNYLLGKLEKRIRQTDLLIWDGMVCKIVSNPSEWGGVMVTAIVYRLTSKPFVPDRNSDSFCLDQSLKP